MQEDKLKDANLEQVLGPIERFGKYNLRSSAIVFVISLLTGIVFLFGSIISAGIPKYRCAVPRLLKAIVNESCSGDWSSFQENITIPWDAEKKEFDQCLRYDLEEVLTPVNCSFWFPEPQNNNSIPRWDLISLDKKKCEKWTYSQEIFRSTMASDFNLICGNEWKEKFSTFLLMGGIMVGILIFGFTSDRFGRKRTYIISTSLVSLLGLGSTFTNDYWTYAILQICIGGCYIGSYTTGFILIMEYSSLRHRVVLSQFLMAGFSCSIMVISGLSYVLREWRRVGQVVIIPLLILTVLVWKVFYESPRWYLACNKRSKAKDVLCKIAEVNGKKLSFAQTNEEAELKNGQDDPLLQNTGPKYSYFDLLRNSTLRKITLVSSYNWFACSCIYFGLTLNASYLSGDVFLNMFLSGLIEIPANLISGFLMHYWGRRPFLCFNYFVSAIALVSMSIVPKDLAWLNLLLFLVVKFGTSAIFIVIYVYTSEMYPTSLRGKGMGCCSSCARIGGMVSIPIIMLQGILPALPYIVFGVIGVLAGILGGILPETKGVPLPETVKDSEDMCSNHSTSLTQQCLPCIQK